MASQVDERTLKREGVCAASLPTTMGIVAGMLVQNTLKYLLKFGKVSLYLGYSALDDYFPTWEIRPNEQCDDVDCRNRQADFKKNSVSRKMDFLVKEDRNTVAVHEDDFGIELVDETSAADLRDDTKVTVGLRSAYSKEERRGNDGQGDIIADTGESLEELMARMKGL